MSVPSQDNPPTSSTTTTSVALAHAHQLSLLAASLELVVDMIAVGGSTLYSIRDGKKVDVVEVIEGRIVGTTHPSWIYLTIRELISEAAKHGWSMKILDL